MGFKLSMLTAVAVSCISVAAGAAPPSGSPAQPPATPQSTAPGQVGNTPGQAQTSPGEAKDLTPAVTGQTPSGQATGSGQADDSSSLKPATKADLKAGATVSDSKGGTVGKIESVEADGVLVDTGRVKAKIGLKSFMHGGKGLVIGMSRSELEAAAKKGK